MRDFQEIEQSREFNEGLAYEEHAGYGRMPYTDEEWEQRTLAVSAFVDSVQKFQSEFDQLRESIEELKF